MPPPRLLLGAALLFWGGMTDRTVVGLLLALVIESAHWTRIRWDFGDTAFLRAWRLSVLLIVVTFALVLMDGSGLRSMQRVFSWLPVIFLPLQFVQSYGTGTTTTLATFSQMVRRRRLHAERFGLPFREVRFSFGNVYLALILSSSSLGTFADSRIFLPGVLILSAWALFHALGRSRRLSLPFAVALALAAAGSYAGETALTSLYRYLLEGGPGRNFAHSDRVRTTSLGELGPIKQSPEILWRLRRENGPLPPLLRIASYLDYNSGTWSNPITRLPPTVKSYSEQFENLREVGSIEQPYLICARSTEDNLLTSAHLPRFRLRGAILERDLIPLPGSAASLHGINVADIERNVFGAMRVDPRLPVIDTSVLWQPPWYVELPPWERQGNEGFRSPHGVIPDSEKETIVRIARELDLHRGSTTEKIRKLSDYFLDPARFEYSLYNSVPPSRALTREQRGTLVSRFLTTTRKGHCEFYATASALLLRAAGVPTAYTSGFSVSELDPASGEAVLRGTSAHAWCRAWDEENQTWIDVDLTPPAWLHLETLTPPSRLQELRDRIKIWREDFLIWRSQPGRMTLLLVSFALPFVVGSVFIARMLWRSRRQLESAPPPSRPLPAVATTPLHELETLAARHLGPRPKGAPLTSWLRLLPPEAADPASLDEALRLHLRLRFDPSPADPSLAARLSQLTQALRTRLRAAPRNPRTSD